MSGHSKWSKVKHQKASTDKVKGQAFTKATHAITVAVREAAGVTDPNLNFRLRLAIDKARSVNMPKENIARAIERAAKAGESNIDQVTYEAFGPGGAAVLIQAATDNKQRTVSQVKNVLDKSGGTLATPGAVSFMFQQSGVITLAKSGLSFDALLELALEVGADDVIERDDVYEVYTSPAVLAQVRQRISDQGLVVDNAEIIMRPTIPLTLDGEKTAKLDQLCAKLEELDDVTAVYANV